METIKLPLIALRDLVIFPHMVTHFDCGRSISVNAVETAELHDSKVFLVAQIDPSLLDIKIDDIYKIGTVATIKQILKLPGGIVRVLVEGTDRAELLSLHEKEEYFEAEIKVYPEDLDDENTNKDIEAALRLAEEDIYSYSKLDEKLIPGLLESAVDMSTPGRLVDTAAGYANLKTEDNQKILETINIYDRLVKFHEIMQNEIEVLSIEKNIDKKVKSKMNKLQREYYLKEQLKVIHKELGDDEEDEETIARYKRLISEKKLPEEVKNKAIREVKKLGNTNSASPEYTVGVNYLDWIIDLPWLERKNTIINLKNARKTLDRDHYGLKSVKERILEFIAAKKLSGKNSRSPILCLVGPPGVGKTSIARSVSSALNRDFVRMSLGGITDEAEIRGHRRTYIGALPGKIISLIKKAGANDPVFLLDEIDKIGNSFRGDPASALLEVLDPEQNSSFTDNYLELPFDLSNVFFIATANTIATIPRPLLDRMEVIRLEGYTPNEKFNIGKKYLIDKQTKENGLNRDQIKISDKALSDIIDYYTRESGVRSLEKAIAKIMRKAALEIVEDGTEKISISSRNLHDYLGEKKYLIDEIGKNDEIGMVNGLAWTEVGGTTLSIEATIMDGQGKITLTGSLGDVMKESAIAGISYIATNGEKYDVDPNFRKNKDIHIHVPEGAVPKDGPSAGITITTAVLSALTKRKVRRDIAMTGEITLRGKVLPIGGLKEKLLAAERFGVKKVLIPFENKRDLLNIEDDAIKNLEIIPIKDMEEVAEIALGDKDDN
ncbi:endopeptidase La [uncultured Peptoniphilus sp.]|uniref:endopeptidase La n=1 Tax=uncultured Peptoniphilus sp. TaxID=254354 RepID=UPI00280388E5|nr:endopeptidase La [uncultured Peptoniphilus sp.]